MKTKIPKNVSSYKDRHGNRRWRYRKNGFSAELGTDFGSTDFHTRLSTAEAGLRTKSGVGGNRRIHGTMAWLVAQYKADRKWLGLKSSTKRAYDTSLKPLVKDHGDRHVGGLRPKHIEKIISDMIDTPAAANNMLKRLNGLMKLAMRLEVIVSNPVTPVDPYKISGSGLRTWSEEDLEEFIKKHPEGTIANRVMTLMICTGMARSDAVKFGWSNIKGDRIEYLRQKTETTGGEPISIPIHPDLIPILKKTPKNQETFLQIAAGKPRSPDGLGKDMRKWCNAAGLPDCASHGLRKAICRKLAEAGASAPQIMAVTGHKNLASVQRYIEEANRKRQSNAAFRILWEDKKKKDENSPFGEPSETVRQKNRQNPENKGL